jgi:hypothetical protein
VHDVGLWRIAIAHSRDVADINGSTVDDLDRQIAHFAGFQRRVVDLDNVFEAADLRGAGRLNQVLGGKRIGNVLPGQSQRLQLLRIDVDLDLTLLAAVGIRDRGARHGHQRRAQLIDGDVAEDLLGEPLARQRELNDRNRRSTVVEDQRRRRARRHLLEDRLRDRRNLRVGGADVGVRLEEDLDDADAVIGVRRDMLDVVDGRRQNSLILGDDAAGHLIRRQTRVLPDDADDRYPDIREDIDRRPHGRQRPDNQEQQREHDECVWPVQGNTDQFSHGTGIPGSNLSDDNDALRHLPEMPSNS